MQYSQLVRPLNEREQNNTVGFGVEYGWVSEEAQAAYEHYALPISRTELSQKFRRLSATWEYNNEMNSSVSAMSLQPEYQEIIGMGKAVLPFLFRELMASPNHWFWALKSITGEDPVPVADRGNLAKMTEAWVKWGKQEGYV